MTLRTFLGGTLVAAMASTALPAFADGELNLYSARHYDSDILLYEAFTEATGIAVNVIEDKAGALIERIRAEGSNSPGDIFMTADASNLMNAAADGMFQPTISNTLEARIPENLRHPDGLWFAFTKRARIIMVRNGVNVEGLETYEDLADPKFADKICIRSSGNIYNQSLVGSLIAAHGEAATAEWVQGLVANMARDPESNDTGQIRAVAAGECDIAVANTYYLARLARSDDPDDQAVVEAIDVILPNQDDRGVHVNISGAGVLTHSPNPNNAVAFLEFLASDEVQLAFAEGNNEWPAVDGVAHATVLDDLYGDFVQDDVNPAVFGGNRGDAQRIMEANGWQ